MSRVVDSLWRFGLRVAYGVLRAVWFVLRPRHRGTLVAVWYDGRVLVITNSYRRSLSFPGGGVRQGEKPVEAAARELREEVGILVQPSELRFVREIHTRVHFQRDRCAFFELDLASPPNIVVDRREVVSGEFMSSDEALTRALLPPVRTYLLSLRERRSAGLHRG